MAMRVENSPLEAAYAALLTQGNVALTSQPWNT